MPNQVQGQRVNALVEKEKDGVAACGTIGLKGASTVYDFGSYVAQSGHGKMNGGGLGLWTLLQARRSSSARFWSLAPGIGWIDHPEFGLSITAKLANVPLCHTQKRLLSDLMLTMVLFDRNSLPSIMGKGVQMPKSPLALIRGQRSRLGAMSNVS
jgi:hypothetical protein